VKELETLYEETVEQNVSMIKANQKLVNKLKVAKEALDITIQASKAILPPSILEKATQALQQIEGGRDE